jgi:hypothetical protein
MTKTISRLFISITALSSVLLLQTVHAEQPMLTMITPDQFIIQLPEVDREALVERVGTLRSQLIQRKQALVQNVADRQLKGSDAILTAILPGGLLYAGFKKIRYEQAKNELDRISADIEEFSDDLVAMQTLSPQVVAVVLQP